MHQLRVRPFAAAQVPMKRRPPNEEKPAREAPARRRSRESPRLARIDEDSVYARSGPCARGGGGGAPRSAKQCGLCGRAETAPPSPPRDALADGEEILRSARVAFAPSRAAPRGAGEADVMRGRDALRFPRERPARRRASARRSAEGRDWYHVEAPLTRCVLACLRAICRGGRDDASRRATATSTASAATRR